MRRSFEEIACTHLRPVRPFVNPDLTIHLRSRLWQAAVTHYRQLHAFRSGHCASLQAATRWERLFNWTKRRPRIKAFRGNRRESGRRPKSRFAPVFRHSLPWLANGRGLGEPFAVFYKLATGIHSGERTLNYQLSHPATKPIHPIQTVNEFHSVSSRPAMDDTEVRAGRGPPCRESEFFNNCKTPANQSQPNPRSFLPPAMAPAGSSSSAPPQSPPPPRARRLPDRAGS